MPRKKPIEDYVETDPTMKGFGPKRFGRRYPWDAWFRQTVFILEKGKHYNCKTYTMAQIVRNAASANRHNVRVSIRTSNDGKRLRVEVIGKLDKSKPSTYKYRPPRVQGVKMPKSPVPIDTKADDDFPMDEIEELEGLLEGE